jgi:hypothetical protein
MILAGTRMYSHSRKLVRKRSHLFCHWRLAYWELDRQGENYETPEKSVYVAVFRSRIATRDVRSDHTPCYLCLLSMGRNRIEPLNARESNVF